MTGRRSGEVEPESEMAWETTEEFRSGEVEQGVCGVIAGAFSTLKALSGHVLKPAVGALLPVPFFLPGVSVHDRVFPAVAAVSGDGRAAGEDPGGGRHGDQVRRCEGSVWEELTPKTCEKKLLPRPKIAKAEAAPAPWASPASAESAPAPRARPASAPQVSTTPRATILRGGTPKGGAPRGATPRRAATSRRRTTPTCARRTGFALTSPPRAVQQMSRCSLPRVSRRMKRRPHARRDRSTRERVLRRRHLRRDGVRRLLGCVEQVIQHGRRRGGLQLRRGHGRRRRKP